MSVAWGQFSDPVQSHLVLFWFLFGVLCGVCMVARGGAVLSQNRHVAALGAWWDAAFTYRQELADWQWAGSSFVQVSRLAYESYAKSRTMAVRSIVHLLGAKG